MEGGIQSFIATCSYLAWETTQSLKVSPSAHVLHRSLVGLACVNAEALYVGHTAYTVLIVLIIGFVFEFLHMVFKSSSVDWS